ncbi:DUF4148 domain-containing protein [Paraburkholderia rhizosphaerae]|uniref:Uncharacterized protein DUF4148 n=1 Tax=Paraburkholderia rhizosphaerae TaxID=480658 RepID=A0A4R8LZN3_9BURK|nr:DUF4148 domain-containing protein [Paraburkholderia rhizosphaerae]TDY53992.1 uncharacterized protein DUF4148 [Paraburkholderia rhizosphaerae]
MKKLIPAVLVATLLAAPVISFAQASQSNQPLTRAQVREELVQLEKAGYDPLSDRQEYPRNIQAAEARLQAQKAQNPVAQGDTSGYGPQVGGTSQTGHAAADETGPQSVFFGH